MISSAKSGPRFVLESMKKFNFYYALMLLSLILFPYNIACWVIGLVLYYIVGVGKEDYSGDTWLALVLFAPATLPIVSYGWVKEKLRAIGSGGRPT